MTIQEWIDAGRPWNSFILGDCMEYMKTVPDKFFELAIVDPPYDIKQDGKILGRNKNLNKQHCNWNYKPNNKYFQELKRISKNQIIWGGNYFKLGVARCYIIWDKKQPVKQFARCELAWTSFDKNSEIVEYSYFGNINSDFNRFHPTQKPIYLYRWLLQNYAKKGDKIFDSHVGSASSLIACMEEGFNYVGCELDKDYYKSACERIKIYKSQLKLF